MRGIKLSSFKRFLMLGLVFMTNTFFGTNFAYASIGLMADCSGCTGGRKCYTYSELFGSKFYISWVNFNPIGGNPQAFCFDQSQVSLVGTVMATNNVCSAFGKQGTGVAKLEFIGCITQNAACSYVSTYEPSECYCNDGYKAGTNMCEPCGYGYYGDNGSCYACSKGYYSDKTTATSCSKCPTGRYASTTGLSTCAACPKGTYGSSTGLTTCVSCAVGYYQSQTAKSSCSACPSFQVSGGSCVFCTFVPPNAVCNPASPVSFPFKAKGMTAAAGATAVTSCYANLFPPSGINISGVQVKNTTVDATSGALIGCTHVEVDGDQKGAFYVTASSTCKWKN